MVVCGLFIGAIIIALKWKRKQPPKIRLDPKSAKQKAINECKNDEDNPDNFIVKNWVIKRVGQEGLPRTPILWLTGVGSELKEKIDAIVNLDNPKGEIGWMRDKTDIEVKEAIRLMAENPESEITEQTVTGFDPYGRPQSTTTTKKVSQREKEEADKKAEAELANTL